MAFNVRAGTPDDVEQIIRHDLIAFHYDPDDRELTEPMRLVIEPGRCLLAYDGDDLVGHACAYTRELTVPGNVIPAAFVTLVGVAATHRRQGIASTMLKRQLRDVRRLGEPVAILWASEGRIYQRFGYGLASLRLNLTIDNREVRLTRQTTRAGKLRAGSPERLRPQLTAAYEAVRSSRPGLISRNEAWWEFQLTERPSHRQGFAPGRAVVHEGPDGPDGYAVFRVRPDWDDKGPRGVVDVWNVVAADGDAYAELWRFLLGIDLTDRVTYSMASLDEPIQYMVNEPRMLGGRVCDAHWVRLVDVPAALASRCYRVPVDLVLEVSDELLPENAGRYRLAADPAGARCEPTTDPADLVMDVSDLGALYLGGSRLGALADAGRVRELSPGAVALGDAAFGWHRYPAAVEMF